MEGGFIKPLLPIELYRAMSETKKTISQDRKRTNILHSQELAFIAYLVERMPRWVTSNMLTALGLTGNLLVAVLMCLSSIQGAWLLLLTPLAFWQIGILSQEATQVVWLLSGYHGRLDRDRSHRLRLLHLRTARVEGRRLHLCCPLWRRDDHLSAPLQGHRSLLHRLRYPWAYGGTYHLIPAFLL